MSLHIIQKFLILLIYFNPFYMISFLVLNNVLYPKCYLYQPNKQMHINLHCLKNNVVFVRWIRLYILLNINWLILFFGFTYHFSCTDFFGIIKFELVIICDCLSFLIESMRNNNYIVSRNVNLAFKGVIVSSSKFAFEGWLTIIQC